MVIVFLAHRQHVPLHLSTFTTLTDHKFQAASTKQAPLLLCNNLTWQGSVLPGGQGLNGCQQSQPVGLEDGGVGHDLAVALDEALTAVVIDGHVETVSDEELDDPQEPAQHSPGWTNC